jgi:hypothetical protein
MISALVPAIGHPRQRGRKPSGRSLALVVAAVVVTAGLVVARPPAAAQAGVMTISGVVFYDKNGNGTRDAGEWGIPGVQLALYADNGSGTWQLKSDPGTHQTGSSGAYTFFVSTVGLYQVRVVGLDFNPNAIPGSGNFEVAVHQNTVRAFQTAASAGWTYQPDVPGMPVSAPNQVIAHCYSLATGSVASLSGVQMSGAYGATVPTLSCHGAQPWPYTNPAMPAISTNLNSPSYILNNQSGTVVPVYSTVAMQSDYSPMPNTDFGLATTADETVLNSVVKGQMADLISVIAGLLNKLMGGTGGLFAGLVLFR